MLLLVLVLGVPREHQNRSEIEIDASTKAFFWREPLPLARKETVSPEKKALASTVVHEKYAICINIIQICYLY
jgi:hypothetical protein